MKPLSHPEDLKMVVMVGGKSVIDLALYSQNLKPSSPLLSTFSLPKADISSTPLVAFRRIDLLFKNELIYIHKSP